MSGGVAGHIEDVEGELEPGNNDAVAFAQRLGARGDAFAGGTEDGDFSAQTKCFQQVLDAAYVVGVVMGADDSGEFKIVCTEVVENRRSVAWIDNGGMHAVVNHPEIVVLECRYRMNGESWRGGHTNSVKIKT